MLQTPRHRTFRSAPSTKEEENNNVLSKEKEENRINGGAFPSQSPAPLYEPF